MNHISLRQWILFHREANALSSHGKTERKIKYIVLNERSQSEKTTHHMIQLYNMLVGKTDEGGGEKDRFPGVGRRSEHLKCKAAFRAVIIL